MRKVLIRQTGSVGLEAMLSLCFMLGAFFSMWGVAVIIFNQTRLTTATQSAARGAMVIYEDRSYRGYSTAASASLARAAATGLLAANTHGMAPDQLSGTPPVNELVPSNGFIVECAPSFTGGFNYSRCSNSNEADSAVTRIIVNSQSRGSYWLLNGLSLQNPLKQRNQQTLQSIATSFSVAPGADL